MKLQTTPDIAMTMGDAAGIGPEIIVKTLSDADAPCQPIVVGDVDILNAAAAKIGAQLHFTTLDRPKALPAGQVGVIGAGKPLRNVQVGLVDAATGRAAFDYIHAAINLATTKKIKAIVTAPINKEALAAAGVRYPGHTEMLADLGGTGSASMMLVNNELRVVLVTIHCSLRVAIDQISVASVLRAIRLADRGTERYGVTSPRVAVAGLNPHAGEGGMFGREDIDVIAPAIAAAKAEGIDASGPWPGDTVFMQAREGRFDVVVAQYHDQGLIPIKYMGLEDGVNVTLGLPFVRTSPDHGTAFDIAGKGIANHKSLLNAVHHAVRLVQAGPGKKGAT